MMSENQTWLAIIAIVIVLAIIVLWVSKKNREGFDASPYQASKELDSYFGGPGSPTAGIKNYLVDTMTCSKSCCGDQWPVPFDGLTSTEIEKCIETRGTPGPFVRTDYSCGNGPDGVGCPCITKKAFDFIVNHGTNAPDSVPLDPSLLIRNDDIVSPYESPMSPYEQLQSQKSFYSNRRKMNDIALQRGPKCLSGVQSYGSVLPYNAAELNSEYPSN